jgi:opacity protein-like surface antigen
MMQRALKVVMLAAVIAVVLSPTQARADGFIIPFAGVNFGNQPVEGSHSNFGFSAGGMGGGIIGGEFDLGYGSNIFEESVSNHVLTLTGNLIVGIPVGGQSGAGLRPYLVGGIGYMQSHQDASPGFAELNGNDFAFDLGGGIMGFFSDHVGLRGDIRYFRNFTSDFFDSDADPELDLGPLDFWRATIGLVIR